eukprot:gene23293-30529_t
MLVLPHVRYKQGEKPHVGIAACGMPANVIFHVYAASVGLSRRCSTAHWKYPKDSVERFPWDIPEAGENTKMIAITNLVSTLVLATDALLEHRAQISQIRSGTGGRLGPRDRFDKADSQIRPGQARARAGGIGMTGLGYIIVEQPGPFACAFERLLHAEGDQGHLGRTVGEAVGHVLSSSSLDDSLSLMGSNSKEDANKLNQALLLDMPAGFKSWAVYYDKVYATNEEEEQAFQAWKECLFMVADHNAVAGASFWEPCGSCWAFVATAAVESAICTFMYLLAPTGILDLVAAAGHLLQLLLQRAHKLFIQAGFSNSASNNWSAAITPRNRDAPMEGEP